MTPPDSSVPADDEVSRRAWIRLATLFSLGALAPGGRSEAADYTSAVEVFDTVDRLEAEVGAMLQALAGKVPTARQFARSLLVDHHAHRGVRDQLRRRLKLPRAPRLGAGVTGEVTLAGLRSSQEALVYAHAEGLVALGDVRAVDLMARHMVELSRHLTVIDLWIESEGGGE